MKSTEATNMWRSFSHGSSENVSIEQKEMRYFIYYPPTKSIRLIDVTEKILVNDVIDLVKKEFNLNIQDSRPSETVLVLTYNGAELKGKWSLLDLGIPSGAIIRCGFRDIEEPQLYVHCNFNKQILKLFDSSIEMETTVAVVRKKISDRLGLPLSCFCLQRFEDQKRLYDEQRLMDHQVRIHGHVHLKVWHGYEKLISSFIKGFSETYAHDDLTRYYQIQIALYIAAFYGHMELATSVMQLGARTDRPVGEHPSRQWSSEKTQETLRDSLKCPIHVAVEQGHVKMVDLFVRQSILCTQVRDPVSGRLPYLLALACSFKTKTKEDRQRYRVIYYFLHDKRYNLRIPLNANGDIVTQILTSTVSAKTMHRTSTNHVTVSLPFYCRLIRWYERARERAWKKYGGRFYNSTQTKRVYPQHGLLGYKVLIDGYNNNFEVPPATNVNSRTDHDIFSVNFTAEEREKILHIKSMMKRTVAEERTRSKPTGVIHLKNIHRTPTFQLSSQRISESEKSRSQSISDNNESLTTSSTRLNLKLNPIDPSVFPVLHSSISAHPQGRRNPQGPMSSADAFAMSSSRHMTEINRERERKHQTLMEQVKKSTEIPNPIKDSPAPTTITMEPPAINDLDNYIPLPERFSIQRSSPIKSHLDVDIHRSTVKPYERYASASTRRTAVRCLEEASFFKGKSWLKQVEISKEMMKRRVKQRIRRAEPTLPTSKEISRTVTESKVVRVN